MVDTVINILTNFGFPIAMCGVLGWFCYYMINKYIENSEQNESDLREVIKNQQKIIIDNTTAIQTLVDKITELNDNLR